MDSGVDAAPILFTATPPQPAPPRPPAPLADTSPPCPTHWSATRRPAARGAAPCIGHLLAAAGDQPSLTNLNSLLRHHIGPANLAQALVGHADHSHLRNGQGLGQQPLDLGRVAIEATDDEQVLDAVGDAQVVEYAYVAGVPIAIRVDGDGL